MSTTHVAGPLIHVGRRSIQRCLICGEKLADSAAVEITAYALGAIVRVGDGPTLVVGEISSGEKLPFDNCLILVEN